jgi:hypothetical protein
MEYVPGEDMNDASPYDILAPGEPEQRKKNLMGIGSLIAFDVFIVSF